MKKFIYIILLSQLLFSCSTPETTNEGAGDTLQNPDEATFTDDQIRSLNITVGKIEMRALSNSVRTNGMLDVPPQNMVTISTPLGGFVKHTELLQGMKVKKGQLLVVMEHSDYIQLQQDYLDKKSQLEFLELEYKRQQDLAAENVNATKILQQAKSNYTGMKAIVEGLRSRLKLIHISAEEIENGEIKNTISIVAPISGFVTQVNVNIGAYVNPTDAMFKLVDTEHLHAEAQVFEKDLMRLKVGQVVSINLTNETSPRAATVYLIGKEISEERTVRVHCHLAKEDPSLIPGMYFSALIETGEAKVTAVPDNAIANFEGKSYLFIATNKNTFLMKEIKTGLSESGYVEVILPDGFDLNSTIALNGTYALISKFKNSEE